MIEECESTTSPWADHLNKMAAQFESNGRQRLTPNFLARFVAILKGSKGSSTPEGPMPQIWLNYAELSNFWKCDASVVRRVVADQKWPRKRSEDGFTRVKLSPVLAHQFMLDYQTGATNSLTIPVPKEIGPGVLGR